MVIGLCTPIMLKEIEKLDMTLYRSTLPQSRGFAIMAFRWFNYDFIKEKYSFKSYLKNPDKPKYLLEESIAIKKSFEQLNDEERLEIIQDYFYNQLWHTIISLKDKLIEEGENTLGGIERDKVRAEAHRKEELAILEKEEHHEAEEREKQRIKASVAGKLIDRSISKVFGNSCNYPGIYLIVNNKTLDFYIGESQNISFRRLTHLGEMADPNKNHHISLIQEHYNKYGADSFDFYVLERVNDDTVDGKARKSIEAFYIREFKPTYNLSSP
jgi:hypothetical protein